MILILVSLIVLLSALLIQITKDTNAFARWLFDFISDWAVPLSAGAAVVIAALALRAFQENRRATARLEIRAWAKEALENLATQEGHEIPMQERAELEKVLQSIEAGSFSAQGAARYLDSKVESKVRKAIATLSTSLITLEQSKGSFDGVTRGIANAVERVKSTLKEVIDIAS